MEDRVSSEREVATISQEELALRMEQGDVQVVNVLEDFPGGYLRLIRGSRHIPLSKLEQRSGELDRARDVVVYCASVRCAASHEAAVRLARAGFRVRAYEGGIEEWVKRGLPTELDRGA